MSEEGFVDRIGGVLVEIVKPILIILMVGSLGFFLLEVVYSGPAIQGLKFKIGCFTVAAVLTSRIAIAISPDRAKVYMLLLGIAVLVGFSRFLDFFAILVVVLPIWWCAGRLTWDCTFIDASRDVSAQGLLELARQKLFGRARKPADLQGAAPSGAANASADAPVTGTRWPGWLEALFRRQQTNTPGLWVFYFVVCAFPFFGIGQALIHDSTGRGYAILYFFVFMASGLGLMMTTSLVGLDRYLKQRRTGVPVAVARSWLILGSVFALTVLLVALWLPRPTTSLSLIGNLPKFTSKLKETNQPGIAQGGDSKNKLTDLSTSQRPSGKTDAPSGGQGGQQPGRSGSSGQQSQNQRSDGPAKSGSGSQTDPNSKNTSDKSGGSQPGGKHNSGPQDPKGSSSQGGGKQSGAESGGQKSPQVQHQSNQGSAKEPQSKSRPNTSDRPSAGEQDQQGANARSGTKTPQQPGDNDASDNSKNQPAENKQAQSNDQPTRRLTSPKQQRELARRSASQANSENENQAQEQDKKQNVPPASSAARSSGGSQRNPSSAPSHSSPSPSSLLLTLLKFLTWLVLLIVLIFVAIRYRQQIAAAWRNFWNELREWWNRLFLRKSPAGMLQPGAASLSTLAPPTASYSDFTNPFVSGEARGWSPAQLVTYTFRAFEAWADQHHCGREPDQTPYEFARRASKQHREMSQGVQRLAVLYSQLAYSPGAVSAGQLGWLHSFWSQMDAHASGKLVAGKVPVTQTEPRA